jgi:DNA-directed RNA polymerase specialized sigma24 family protein
LEQNDSHDVTHWIRHLKVGDYSATQPLWQLYYYRLVRLARTRLPGAAHEDSEDVALSAFKSFCLGAARGRFPQLSDRHDLWRLLLFITAQKIADHLERANAKKRGRGMLRNDEAVLEQIIGREPSPEFAVSISEEVECLLAALGDDQLKQIATWKLEGLTNQEISAGLGCAVRTVANKLDLIRGIWRQRQQT